MLMDLMFIVGILDSGHMVGITNSSQSYTLYHETSSTMGEKYTFDGGQLNIKILNTDTAFVGTGIKSGIEHHYKSSIYNEYYLTSSPLFIAGTKYKYFNALLSVNIGKGFYTISKSGTGKDDNGFAQGSTAMFAISFNLDYFNRGK